MILYQELKYYNVFKNVFHRGVTCIHGYVVEYILKIIVNVYFFKILIKGGCDVFSCGRTKDYW